MTKLDALKELAAKVEAGPYLTGADTKSCMAAFPEGAGERGSAAGNACAAWSGSLDAAKALHEAVLPDMLWQFTPLGACYVRDKLLVELGASGYVYPDNPARAWLLAVLRALIAQEEAA